MVLLLRNLPTTNEFVGATQRIDLVLSEVVKQSRGRAENTSREIDYGSLLVWRAALRVGLDRLQNRLRNGADLRDICRNASAQFILGEIAPSLSRAQEMPVDREAMKRVARIQWRAPGERFINERDIGDFMALLFETPIGLGVQPVSFTRAEPDLRIEAFDIGVRSLVSIDILKQPKNSA